MALKVTRRMKSKNKEFMHVCQSNDSLAVSIEAKKFEELIFPEDQTPEHFEKNIKCYWLEPKHDKSY